MIRIELCKISYRFSNDEMPIPLKNLLKCGSSFHHYETRNRNAPISSAKQSTIFNCSYLNKCSTEWLVLPINIKNKQSLDSFSKALKKLYLKHYT